MIRAIIKYSVLILVLDGLLFSCGKLERKQDQLEKTIIQIVEAFKEKNDIGVNNLISKDIGLIILFRRGVFDEFIQTDKIDFNIPIPEYLPYLDFSTDFNLIFGNLPNFDCDSMKWSKVGLYCDTTRLDTLLSSTAKKLKKWRGDDIPDFKIKSFEELEKKSKRIVISDKEGGELVFYLTLIDNKWYLTILDRVTSDCSA